MRTWTLLYVQRHSSYYTPPCFSHSFFFFNDTATTEIYTLSLHDALPIYCSPSGCSKVAKVNVRDSLCSSCPIAPGEWNTSNVVFGGIGHDERSEEHTSELQSRPHLVCRLLLEKKNGNVT